MASSRSPARMRVAMWSRPSTSPPMPCSACSCGGGVDRGLLGGRQGEPLAEAEGIEVVEVDVDVAHAVVGEVGQERERQVVGRQ